MLFSEQVKGHIISNMCLSPGLTAQVFILAQGKDNHFRFFRHTYGFSDQYQVLFPRGKYNIIVFPVKITNGGIGG